MDSPTSIFNCDETGLPLVHVEATTCSTIASTSFLVLAYQTDI